MAAALALPAQADVPDNTARHAPHHGLGEGAGIGGSPLGGLLGGLTGGGLLGGLLGGALPGGQMTEAEMSPIAGGVLLGGGGLTESLPVLSGASRMATPSVKAARQDPGQAASEGVTSGTMNDTTMGAEPMPAGLTQAARRALPGAAGGELSPVVGQVAPAEVAPVLEALPGATEAVRADELTPLVEDASGFVNTSGTRAIGSYGDLLTALGWTTDSLTSSVRDSWDRD
ncbi:hypothetical protein [Nonomuraea basaltis]|uniref:hypothetical protein n=1 Tax=Nonomuraea basaltis TaxID=2495887 RepID=UPI00110C4F32|nr:hypothetical protein [Nonomuraea basaltis]